MVPLIVAEASTNTVQSMIGDDPLMCVWWSTEVECASAIARLEREDALSDASTTAAFERLDALAESWNEVQPAATLRAVARRLLRVHDLRAADALQLAAALVAAERVPSSLAIVTLDERLAGAARREGFTALP